MIDFKKFYIIRILFCIAIIFGSFSLYAEKIHIRKSALNNIPTLHSKGIAGSPLMTKNINRNLKNCGWFKITTDSSSDYIIKGNLSGSTLAIVLSRGNGVNLLSFQIKVNKRQTNQVAQEAVDYILKKLFKINGLCRSKIAFCAEIKKGKKEIYSASFDGSDVKKITSNNTLSVSPNWGPKQQRLLYTMYSKMFTDVIEYDLPSKKSRRLIQFPGLNAGATVSPDGNYFAVILSKDGKVDLYIKSISTKWLKRLTNNIFSESSPCWSPSGGDICFVSNLSRKPQLYIISSQGGKAKKLQTLGREAISPDWSADNKIVYATKMGKNYAIAIIDLNTNKSSIVISAAGDWESPSWAPDNRHIVASRLFNGRSDIYVIDSWTGRAKRILAGKIPFSLPCW